jgi:hypothetical protein
MKGERKGKVPYPTCQVGGMARDGWRASVDASGKIARVWEGRGMVARGRRKAGTLGGGGGGCHAREGRIPCLDECNGWFANMIPMPSERGIMQDKLVQLAGLNIRTVHNDAGEPHIIITTVARG